ncbi:MAG TPA: hypothetical protein VN520_28880 [Streptomyces sp.]|nr:hypothetical protein [Streptomyces sp.]HWU10338.1 hypothetical protein [Streptomyces sp.]
MTTALAPTAVTTCEACWNAPVESVRITAAGTDLLCQDCALGHFPRRVDLFPPFGVYGVTAHTPDQGPSPPCPPVPSPPGTPPV